MSAPATLYLHVGLGRCGSGSIQAFGRRHREELRARGLEYPSPLEMGFDADLARGGNGRALAYSRDPADAVGRIAAHLAADDADRFFMSAEQLLGSGDDRLRLLVDGLAARDIRTVALFYVREQREWLVSRWAQGLKTHGWSQTLEAFVAEYRDRGFRSTKLRYDLRCTRLAAIFGREHLMVRRFTRRALAGGDARVDAYGVAGVDVTDLVAPDPQHDNASASAEEAVLARIVNALPAGEVLHPAALLRYAQARRGEVSRRDLHRLAPPQLMREIAAHYEPHNERLRQAFLPEIPPPVLPSSIPDDYAQVTEDDVLGTASIGLLGDFAARRGARVLRAVTRARG
jgi:hypothetical protein